MAGITIRNSSTLAEYDIRLNDSRAVSITADYTAAVGDIISCDASSTPITITLPTAVAGDEIIIRKNDATTNKIIVGELAEIIFQNTALHLLYGTTWGII